MYATMHRCKHRHNHEHIMKHVLVSHQGKVYLFCNAKHVELPGLALHGNSPRASSGLKSSICLLVTKSPSWISDDFITQSTCSYLFHVVTSMHGCKHRHNHGHANKRIMQYSRHAKDGDGCFSPQSARAVGVVHDNCLNHPGEYQSAHVAIPILYHYLDV